MSEQATTVTQCPKFGWCVMGHAHKGQCSSAHYTLTEVVEPRVEAGDRARETARSVDETYMAQGSTLNLSDGRIEYVASVIRDAMNAQEREWREAIAEWRSALMHAWANDHRAVMTALLEIGPAERLLAERGEGR